MEEKGQNIAQILMAIQKDIAEIKELVQELHIFRTPSKPKNGVKQKDLSDEARRLKRIAIWTKPKIKKKPRLISARA